MVILCGARVAGGGSSGHSGSTIARVADDGNLSIAIDFEITCSYRTKFDAGGTHETGAGNNDAGAASCWSAVRFDICHRWSGRIVGEQISSASSRGAVGSADGHIGDTTTWRADGCDLRVTDNCDTACWCRAE